jgi:hypothetical protein
LLSKIAYTLQLLLIIVVAGMDELVLGNKCYMPVSEKSAVSSATFIHLPSVPHYYPSAVIPIRSSDR